MLATYTVCMSTISAISDNEALKAVRNRDASYDGKLFFGVVTTGVFCRPSCKSRPAKPENMRFYNNAEQARQAGFRACKRCAPEQLNANHEKLIEVARYIESNADQTLTLTTLANKFGLSPTHLQKSFKSVIGISPKAFQDAVRQQRFKSFLKSGESVTDAVFAAGYGSSSRVYGSVADKLGMTPGAYKAGAEGEQISYACGVTEFGYLLLAATDKGVCFAMFGDAEAELLQKLKDEFPKATTSIATNDDQLENWFVEINQYLNDGLPMPAIPLDIRGTAFQMRVWAFLQSINEGEVVSYRDVAIGIGQPTAIRAAATACAKNRIALLIPCHRVLRGDGGIGGYRWGVDTKRELLSLEKQSNNTNKHIN